MDRTESDIGNGVCHQGVKMSRSEETCLMTTTDRACLTSPGRRAFRNARGVSGLLKLNVDIYRSVIVTELSL